MDAANGHMPIPRTDAELAQKIRSRLEQVAAHPRLIQVHVDQGSVTLSGLALGQEIKELIHAVKQIPGIEAVNQDFEVLDSGQKLRTLHQSETSFGYQANFIVGRWSLWIRLLVGATGAAILSQAPRQRGAMALLVSSVGIAALSRAITNQDLTQLFGSLVLPVLRMSRTVRVNAPVDDVFRFWKDFRNYPNFMSYIREVSINDFGGLHWVSKAPGGTQLQWDTSIMSFKLNQEISWKSVPGSIIATEGVVRMHPDDLGSTEVHVELSFAPPAGALGYAAAHFLGFNPDSRIDDDLELMKNLIEDESRLLYAGQGVENFG